MKDIYFFKDYLTKTYGKPLYRIPISLPLSCPNRDKQNGQGCTFCSEDGSAALHLKKKLDLAKQVSDGIEYATNRYGATAPYIAYFQAFTNTYAPVDELRNYYEKVLAEADFKIVMIATRPDALKDDVLEYLSELNERYDLWIELGVQTSNDQTSDRIMRGHDFQCVIDGVTKLAKLNIKTAAHIILGLPGETLEDYRQTARDIAKLPFSAVKVHNLLVLKKTKLAFEYRQKQFKTLNEYEYAAALLDVLSILPDNWVVFRITADADNSDIIAPKWWMKKGQFINYIREALNNGVLSQELKEAHTVPKIETADGSFTFYHPTYKQHFHTLAGAESEAINKFLKPSGILAALQKNTQIKLLDIGFGLGYNVFTVIKEILNHETYTAPTVITSLEQDKKTLEMAHSIFQEDSLEQSIIESLLATQEWHNENITLKLVIGDARQSAKALSIKAENSFDFIFMDGFSPDKNPELWTFDFARYLKRALANRGTIVTYSSAFPVRSALLRNNLYVGETEAYGRKRGGTIASPVETSIQQPLSEKDIDIISKSTAGVCYRDSSLKSTTKQILRRREKEVKRLRSYGIPKWYTNK